jgi:hypothetical protein
MPTPTCQYRVRQVSTVRIHRSWAGRANSRPIRPATAAPATRRSAVHRERESVPPHHSGRPRYCEGPAGLTDGARLLHTLELRFRVFPRINVHAAGPPVNLHGPHTARRTVQIRGVVKLHDNPGAPDPNLVRRPTVTIRFPPTLGPALATLTAPEGLAERPVRAQRDRLRYKLWRQVAIAVLAVPELDGAGRTRPVSPPATGVAQAAPRRKSAHGRQDQPLKPEVGEPFGA